VIRIAFAPLRLTARLLDRVQFVLDSSPIALSTTARRVRWVVASLLILYAATLVLAGGMQLVAGVLVAIVALIVATGRIGLFARDWAPLFLMMAVYGAAFEVAARLSRPTWYSPQIDADRFLGFGHVPSVWLQQQLDAPHDQVLAVVTAAAYASHYYFPVLLGLYVWWYHRENGFFDLIYGYLTVLALATVVFVLAPTAPPWLASERGLLPALHDVVKMGLLDMNLDTLANHKGDPNLYLTRAAFPSVHAAWPMVSLLVVLRHRMSRVVAMLVVVQMLAVWFAIVYSGEHYLIDVVAGASLAAVTVPLVARHRTRVGRLILGDPAVPVDAVGPPPDAREIVVVTSELARRTPAG
jgi:hypothetical protein